MYELFCVQNLRTIAPLMQENVRFPLKKIHTKSISIFTDFSLHCAVIFIKNNFLQML